MTVTSNAIVHFDKKNNAIVMKMVNCNKTTMGESCCWKNDVFWS